MVRAIPFLIGFRNIVVMFVFAVCFFELCKVDASAASKTVWGRRLIIADGDGIIMVLVSQSSTTLSRSRVLKLSLSVSATKYLTDFLVIRTITEAVRSWVETWSTRCSPTPGNTLFFVVSDRTYTFSPSAATLRML